LNETVPATFNLAVPSRLASFAGLVAFVLPLTACDDDVADPSFEPTSVPESKPIDELDEEEEQDFCEEASVWAEDILLDDLPRILCNTSAIGESAQGDGTVDLAACQAARDACLEDPEVIEDLDADDLQCNFEGVESCDATVGEFSSCFEEAAQLLDRSADAITCERFAAGDIPQERDFVLSAGCESIFERCGGEESEEDGEFPPPE